MAYEFKSLGTVEALTEVPENANALVEVDGAIKRVSSSELGGGKYDLVITHDMVNDSVVIDSGSYQNVYNKIMVDKEPPKILIKYTASYGDTGYGVTSSFDYADIVVSSEDANSHYLCIRYYTWGNGYVFIEAYPDDSISWYY